MANNSAKKNKLNIQTTSLILTYGTYFLIAWLMIFNTFYLVSNEVSIWHWLLCLAVSASSYFCFKQIMKCWELQLPSEAAEYYYDVIALNAIVQLFDPFTHTIWYISLKYRHAYWLIAVYVGCLAIKWGWAYITPKYDMPEEGEGEDDKKKEKRERKEKREKIKYLKK